MSFEIRFLFLIILLIITYTLSQIVTIPLFLNHILTTIISVNFGSRQTPHFFIVSLTSNHSVIYPGFKYNDFLSTSIQLTSEPVFFSENMTGLIATDTFYFANQLTTNIKFIYVKEAQLLDNFTKLFSSSLSFSRFDESIIHQLSNDFIIKGKILSFGKNNITIGDIDDSIREYEILYTKAIQYENKWASIIRGIVFSPLTKHTPQIDINDYSHSEVNEIMIYKSDENSIIAPYKYLNIFIKKYFGNDLMQKCALSDSSKNNNNEIEIECNKNIVEELKDIIFFIDDIAIAIEPKHLFNSLFEFIQKHRFRIKFNKNANDNTWVFGTGVIKRFNLVFNEDKSSIGYSNELKVWKIKSNFPNVSSESKSMMWIIHACISILCLGSIFLLRVRFKFSLLFNV